MENAFDISQLGLGLMDPAILQKLSGSLGGGAVGPGMGLLQMLAGGNPFGGGTAQAQLGAPQQTGAPGNPKPGSSAGGFAPMLLSQLMQRSN